MNCLQRYVHIYRARVSIKECYISSKLLHVRSPVINPSKYLTFCVTIVLVFKFTVKETVIKYGSCKNTCRASTLLLSGRLYTNEKMSKKATNFCFIYTPLISLLLIRWSVSVRLTTESCLPVVNFMSKCARNAQNRI